MSTFDGNRLGVIHWIYNRADNFTSSLLLYGNHDSVVDYLFMIFAYRRHYRVIDDSLTSLSYRLANCVIDNLFVSFTNWHHYCVVNNLLVSFVHRLYDCVVNNLLVCFTYRHHNGVLNVFGVGVVHWTANVVRYLLGLSVVDWLHDGVFTSPSLIDRLANRLVNGSVASLSLHASDIDYLVFGNRLILGACTLLCLLFVNNFTNSFHHCMCSWCTSNCSTSAAILVAYRSTVIGVGSTGQSSQQGYQNRHHKQPSHSRSP